MALWGLLLVLYGPLLLHWYDGWLNKSISLEHEYFSHGVIGLPFAAYLLWQRRDRWPQLPSPSLAGSLSGGLLLIFGLALYLSGVPDAINFSLPIVLTGLCLWFKGRAGLTQMGFPLLLVWLATPTQMPYLIAPYTLPLQRFIAGVAGFILFQIGLDVQVEQIYLFVNDRIVEVAPHCAGLKMLFTSLYVGLMLLIWTGTWKARTKVITFGVGIVLLSVSANILRNTFLTLFHGTGNTQAFDWLHESWGGDLYSAGLLGSLVLLLNAIDRWFPGDPSSSLPSPSQEQEC
ncbi:MAG: cyanoexosortase B [Synechococcales bacterium]|nr:cyanoexosortase B [Synechococcales bacterium]